MTLATLLRASPFAATPDVARALKTLRPAVRVDADGGEYYAVLRVWSRSSRELTPSVRTVGVLATEWTALTYLHI